MIPKKGYRFSEKGHVLVNRMTPKVRPRLSEQSILHAAGPLPVFMDVSWSRRLAQGRLL